MQTESPTQDLLVFENLSALVRASNAKRFINFLVDLLAFYIVAILLFIAFYALFPGSDIDSGGVGLGLLDRIFFLVLYALFVGLMEYLFKGKSLGKLITGTRAVTLKGNTISASTAFARGFSRAVPFVVFSAFDTPCNPWQDRWTDTIVIDEKQSANYFN